MGPVAQLVFHRTVWVTGYPRTSTKKLHPLPPPVANPCWSLYGFWDPAGSAGCLSHHPANRLFRVKLPTSDLPWIRKLSMIRLMSEDEIGDELKAYKEQLDALREDMKLKTSYSGNPATG